MGRPRKRPIRGAPPTQKRRMRRYPPGRKCAVCGAPLSQYNPSNYCFLHQRKSW